MNFVYHLLSEEKDCIPISIDVKRSDNDKDFVDVIVNGTVLIEFCPYGKVWIAGENEFNKLRLFRDVK